MEAPPLEIENFKIFLIFITTYLHPSYNDFKVLETTQYHQGQKIEKFFNCIDDKEQICSKIMDATFKNKKQNI